MAKNPLDIEVMWLLRNRYPGFAYRTIMAGLIDNFGREAIMAEFKRQLADAGPNVIPIIAARKWQPPRNPTVVRGIRE
jgi:hypothetical protein